MKVDVIGHLGGLRDLRDEESGTREFGCASSNNEDRKKFFPREDFICVRLRLRVCATAKANS
jgi:hypothetical protein